MIFQLIGDYEFTACTYLAGDETPGNDCSNKTVTNNPPAYCVTGYTNGTDDWISNVTFQEINNTTGPDPNGYGDYTSMVGTVAPGNSYDISIEVTVDGTWEEYTKVWVDWNQNWDFTDPGEEYDFGSFAGTYVFTGPIAVPADAVPGTTRMRVAERWNQAPGPCDEATYGEAEDYTLQVGDPVFGNLDGTVTAAGGGALEGATVMLQGTSYSATTNASGFYEMIDVAVGSYTAECSATGYNTETEDVTIEEGINYNSRL